MHPDLALPSCTPYPGKLILTHPTLRTYPKESEILHRVSVGKMRTRKESLRKVSEDKVSVRRERLCRLKEGKVRLC